MSNIMDMSLDFNKIFFIVNIEVLLSIAIPIIGLQFIVLSFPVI